MKKENYNWWTDPKNQEKVKELSWWDHDENKYYISIPISVVECDGQWVASTNHETEKYLGTKLVGYAQGATREEVIERLFEVIRFTHDYSEECRLSYEPWVPFRKGDWKHTGGKWFTLFGINVYFRYGKGMKGGWYVPFTKFNISLHNYWRRNKKQN